MTPTLLNAGDTVDSDDGEVVEGEMVAAVISSIT